jgi:hypothetical protein
MLVTDQTQTVTVVDGKVMVAALEVMQIIMVVVVLAAILVVVAILLKLCGAMVMGPHQVVAIIHQHMVQVEAVVLEFGAKALMDITLRQLLV